MTTLFLYFYKTLHISTFDWLFPQTCFEICNLLHFFFFTAETFKPEHFSSLTGQNLENFTLVNDTFLPHEVNKRDACRTKLSWMEAVVKYFYKIINLACEAVWTVLLVIKNLIIANPKSINGTENLRCDGGNVLNTLKVNFPFQKVCYEVLIQSWCFIMWQRTNTSLFVSSSSSKCS